MRFHYFFSPTVMFYESVPIQLVVQFGNQYGLIDCVDQNSVDPDQLASSEAS